MDKIKASLLSMLESMLGFECTEKMIHQGQYSNIPCLKLLLSKTLSIGILAGGLFIKIPQILKLMVSESSEGLSIVGLIIETMAFFISVAYNIRHEFPFTTFGEIVFIMIQNGFLVSLAIYLRYRNRSNMMAWLASLIWLFLCFGMNHILSNVIGIKELDFLQSCTLAMVVISKVPQIASNALAKSTGQLSSISVFLMSLGSFARVYTTLQEVNDAKLLIGSVIGATLNFILSTQIVLYWKAPEKQRLKTE